MEDVRLSEAFDALSGYEQLILKLLFVDDLEVLEVARQLGITERKANQRIGGALAKMRTVYLLPVARPRRQGAAELGALWRGGRR